MRLTDSAMCTNPTRNLAAALAVVTLAACSSEPSDPPPPPPPPSAGVAACASQPVTQLAVGQHALIDPVTRNGCVRVPAAGAEGAEYLVVVASGTGTRSTAGVAGAYHLAVGNPSAALSASAAVVRDEVPIRVGRRTAADDFHDMLRRKEAELVASGAARAPVMPAPSIAAAPPVVGHERTFKTCRTVTCSQFDDVPARARYVGNKAAIYMEIDVPTADTLLEVDYQDLGRTFDLYHYPINAAAFGAESDLDGNERVVILLTKSVNNLTPDCTNGRVLGYFYGADLTNGPNSNQGEIFYTLVPSPATATCSAMSRTSAVRIIKPTLIHELQHMINWNQRVIRRGLGSEETWLNEALSHFAEELGGRLIPDEECPGYSSCRSQYVSGNIINSYDYMVDPESHFLIYPISSNGTLEERGASWLFLRWVVDHFASDSILGGDFTPSLVSAAGGAASFAARTGVSFADLVTEWHLATYLDDLPGFVAASPRLRLKSWGLRGVWTNPVNQSTANPPGPFNGFPLVPDQASGNYTRSGTLRGGSARHLRLVQSANGAALDVRLARNAAGDAIDPALGARFGIVRIR